MGCLCGHISSWGARTSACGARDKPLWDRNSNCPESGRTEGGKCCLLEREVLEGIMAALKSGPSSHGRMPVCFGPTDYLSQDKVLETSAGATQFRGRQALHSPTELADCLPPAPQHPAGCQPGWGLPPTSWVFSSNRELRAEVYAMRAVAPHGNQGDVVSRAHTCQGCSGWCGACRKEGPGRSQDTEPRHRLPSCLFSALSQRDMHVPVASGSSQPSAGRRDD